MPKVICNLPNASSLISGVAFAPHGDAVLSEEISEAVAALFLEVPGYVIAEPVSTTPAPVAVVVDPVVEPVVVEPIAEPVVEPVAAVVEPEAEPEAVDAAAQAAAEKAAKAEAKKRLKEEAAAAAQAAKTGE